MPAVRSGHRDAQAGNRCAPDLLVSYLPASARHARSALLISGRWLWLGLRLFRLLLLLLLLVLILAEAEHLLEEVAVLRSIFRSVWIAGVIGSRFRIKEFVSQCLRVFAHLRARTLRRGSNEKRRGEAVTRAGGVSRQIGRTIDAECLDSIGWCERFHVRVLRKLDRAI